MNRILVAAARTPSPYVHTKFVPDPVLRGNTAEIVIEVDDDKPETVSLPYTIPKVVRKLRVVHMDKPAIIVMETQSNGN